MSEDNWICKFRAFCLHSVKSYHFLRVVCHVCNKKHVRRGDSLSNCVTQFLDADFGVSTEGVICPRCSKKQT